MATDTKEKYFELHIPDNTNDLIFSAPLSVGCIAENGDHWMWSGSDGLPYGPVTTIKSLNNISLMPEIGDQLDQQAIADLIAFLRNSQVQSSY